MQDVSGSSGTGRVAQGVELDNGWCIMSWLTDITSVKIFQNMAELNEIHSHEGRTRVVWQDEIYKLLEEDEEPDELLIWLRDIEDRRKAQVLDGKADPTREEVVWDIIKRGGPKVEFNIQNNIQIESATIDIFERCMRACQEIRDRLGPYVHTDQDLDAWPYMVEAFNLADAALDGTGNVAAFELQMHRDGADTATTQVLSNIYETMMALDGSEQPEPFDAFPNQMRREWYAVQGTLTEDARDDTLIYLEHLLAHGVRWLENLYEVPNSPDAESPDAESPNSSDVEGP